MLDSLQAKLGLKAVAHFSLVVEHVKSLKRNKLTLLNPRDTLAKVNRSSLFHSNLFVCSSLPQASFVFLMSDSPLSTFALRILVQQKAGFSFFFFLLCPFPSSPKLRLKSTVSQYQMLSFSLSWCPASFLSLFWTLRYRSARPAKEGWTTVGRKKKC